MHALLHDTRTTRLPPAGRVAKSPAGASRADSCMSRSVHPHPHMSSGAGDPPALARIPQTRARAQTDALSIPHSLPFDNPATETGPPNLIHSTATRHSAQKTSNMASKLQNSLSADPSATRLPLGLGLGVLGLGLSCHYCQRLNVCRAPAFFQLAAKR